MKSSSSKTRRAAREAKVIARSAQSSGRIKCYVESFEHPNGTPDLHLREKSTRRLVRVRTEQSLLQHVAPLSNLLQDSYAHGGGLVSPRNRSEYIALASQVLTRSAREVVVSFDSEFSVEVNISTASVDMPPNSVWCYIEEYSVENEGLNLRLRLRQKVSGRKVEIYGESKTHLSTFLASPRFTGAEELMPNLYEKDGYEDYVLVSGGTAVDSYDVLRFNDGVQLTYLLGPTPDTAYRDAFRVLEEESATIAHSRTAISHLRAGRYREAVLSARLAVELACGGRGADIQSRLTGAPVDIGTAAALLRAKRNIAVHEGDTRVEQPDASEAIDAMNRLLEYLGERAATHN